MIRALVFALSTLACAASASAQDRATPILTLLDRLPVPAGEGIIEVEYGNPGPARGVAMMAAALGQIDDDPVSAPVLRAAPLILARRLMFERDSLMQSHGIDIFGVERFAMVSQGASRTTLMDLPEGVAAGVGAAAMASGFGYQERAFQGRSVFWRGEDDQPDLDRTEDFLGYGYGLSSRLWLDGDLLVLTTSWPMMERAMTGPEGSVGQVPDMRALVSVLDAGLEVPGQVVALRLYPNLGWSDPSDPGGALMLVDLIHGAEEGAVFAFVANSMAEAERHAALARANWDSVTNGVTGQTMAELFGSNMQAVARDMNGTPVVAVAVHGAHDEDDPFWVNGAYYRFNQMLMFMDLAWLMDG